ncbi:MAG: UPF0149 family protein [Arenicella sp.]
MNTIDQYQQLESSLHLAGLHQPSSEAHGLIVGCIANHMHTAKAPNLLALLAGKEATTDGEPSANYAPLHELLNEVYRDTSEVLLENADEFQLLLVDEDVSLAIRTESLADWCRGYLLGLLQSDSISLDQLPEDGPEIARDILAISEAGPNEEGEETEEDAWALAELEEYVKVGVQLVFEFIIRARSEQQPQAPLQ